MTMIVAATFRDLGVLAWDSEHQRPQADGSVLYETDGDPPAIRAYPDGWAACGGSYALALRALELCRHGGTLDELAGRIAPELTVAAASMGDGAEHSQTVLLTVRSGALEAGMFKPAGGLSRFPSSARAYVPPHSDALDDPDALAELFERFTAETTNPSSTLDVIRAIAAFYDRAGPLTPSLSGHVHIGLLGRSADGSWLSERLTGRAAAIAGAPDSVLIEATTQSYAGV